MISRNNGMQQGNNYRLFFNVYSIHKYKEVLNRPVNFSLKRIFAMFALLGKLY